MPNLIAIAGIYLLFYNISELLQTRQFLAITIFPNFYRLRNSCPAQLSSHLVPTPIPTPSCHYGYQLYPTSIFLPAINFPDFWKWFFTAPEQLWLLQGHKCAAQVVFHTYPWMWIAIHWGCWWEAWWCKSYVRPWRVCLPCSCCTCTNASSAMISLLLLLLLQLSSEKFMHITRFIP